jgi:hypothetical protein
MTSMLFNRSIVCFGPFVCAGRAVGIEKLYSAED